MTAAKKAAATTACTATPKTAPKAACMAAPKKAADTVTLKTVFEQLAAGHDLSKKLAQSLLTDFVASVTGILKNGDRVRMRRNPATGAVQIAASKKVAFRAAKELKAAV
jgi:DNA-binding protein HU-beta